MQIGLLEDNPSIVRLLSTILSNVGHNVSAFVDGAAFLASLGATEATSPTLSYNLLLIDLYLPGSLSGWDVINIIRTTIPPEQLPIIVISAASAGELKQLQARHPDIAVIQKPFGMAALLEQIEKHSPARVHGHWEST